ncbi:MAG: cereblon family protein [Desulfobacterales bacterium]
MNSETTNLNLFRQPHEKPGISPGDLPAEDEIAEMVPQDEVSILCRQCRQVITHPDECAEIDGSHQHTFANPGGIVYQIGCFQSAKGCAQSGPATDEFTWFKGFSWRIVVCRACLFHLGWVFTSHARGHFYGLILDRLIFPD